MATRVFLFVVLLGVSLGAETQLKSKTKESSVPAPLSTYDALELAQNGLPNSLPGVPRMMEQLSPNIPSPGSNFITPSLVEVGQSISNAASNELAMDATGESEEDEEAKQQTTLQTALEEIKQDIVLKSKQVMDEKAWVDQVNEIIKQYQVKVQRVLVNIDNLRVEIKTLYKKKRQIENLMLQTKLESKLHDATADLRTLGAALRHVKNKERSFDKNKQDVTQTVNVIKAQLAKLRGGVVEDEGDADEAEA